MAFVFAPDIGWVIEVRTLQGIAVGTPVATPPEDRTLRAIPVTRPRPRSLQKPAREDRVTSSCTETVPARTRSAPGAKSRRQATRHDVGRVLATGEAFSRSAHHKVGTKPRRTG